MQKNIFSKLLLTTTLLSSATFAAERDDDVTSYLSQTMRGVEKAVPQKGGWEKFVDILKENAHSSLGDLGAYMQGGKTLMVDRDPGTFVVGLLNAKMTSASRKFFAPYLKGNSSILADEFDMDGLNSLVKEVQLVLCGMIEETLMKQRSYAWNPKTDTKLKIYEDKTVFRKLLEAIVPNAVPLKGIMISIADQSFIRDYTVNKLNEMTISYLLHYYQQSTGQTLKQSLASVINSFAAKNKGKNEDATTATSSNDQRGISDVVCVKMIEKEEDLLEVKQTENLIAVLEENSALKTYFETIIQHYLRLSIEQVMLPTIERATTELVSEITRKALPSTSNFDVLWKSWTFGGLACSSILGNNLFSMGLGLPVGLVSHSLAHLGTKSVVDWTVSTLTNHKDLWIQSYLDSLIPINKGMHSRYFLNPNPTSLEREIFAQDYGEENSQRHQTFIKALIDDLSKGSFVGSIITAARNIAPSSEVQQTVAVKNKMLSKLRLGKLIAKQKAGKKLTSEEEQTLKNLLMYPSYSLKQEEAAVVKEWRHKTSKDFALFAAELKARQKNAEVKIMEIYELYTQTIPVSIAGVYQSLTHSDFTRDSLDFIEIQEIVCETILNNFPHLSDNDLEVLKLCIADKRFIQEFIQSNLKKVDTLAAEKEFFQSQAFIKELISDYVQKEYKDYLSVHENEIESLKQGFGKGLSQAEIINLHQKMGPQEREELIVKAQKDDRQKLENYVEGLVKQNIPDLVTHYVDEAFRVLDLNNFVQARLDEAGKDFFDKEAGKINLNQNKYEALAQKGEPQQIKLAIAKADYIESIFKADKGFGAFREQLRPLVPNVKLRNTIYTNITNRIASDLLSQVAVEGASEDSTGIIAVDDFLLIADGVTSNETKGIVPFNDFFPAVTSGSDLDFKLILTELNIGHILKGFDVGHILKDLHPSEETGFELRLTEENLGAIYEKVVELRVSNMTSPGSSAFKDAAGLSFLKAYSANLENLDFFDAFEQGFQNLVAKRKEIITRP